MLAGRDEWEDIHPCGTERQRGGKVHCVLGNSKGSASIRTWDQLLGKTWNREKRFNIPFGEMTAVRSCVKEE